MIKQLSFLSAALLAPVLSCIPAVAQEASLKQQRANSLQVIGTFVQAGKAAPSEAVAEAKLFMNIANRLPAQSKRWKWVIVADDAMWTRLMNHLGLEPQAGTSFYAQTDLDHHVSYIRGWTLVHPDQPAANPQFVIAHEMARVILNSRNEKLVNASANQWVEGMQSGRLLQASAVRSTPQQPLVIAQKKPGEASMVAKTGEDTAINLEMNRRMQPEVTSLP